MLLFFCLQFVNLSASKITLWLIWRQWLTHWRSPWLTGILWWKIQFDWLLFFKKIFFRENQIFICSFLCYLTPWSSAKMITKWGVTLATSYTCKCDYGLISKERLLELLNEVLEDLKEDFSWTTNMVMFYASSLEIVVKIRWYSGMSLPKVFMDIHIPWSLHWLTGEPSHTSHWDRSRYNAG